MKRLILLFLVVTLAIGCFAACGGSGNESSSSGKKWPPDDVTSENNDNVNNEWPASEPENNSNYTAENLIWQDEFNGSSLDLTKWSYDTGNGKDGWGNQELEYYREENVRVNGGKLQIMARYEKYDTFDYTSGKIHTRDKFSHTYGRYEARIKLPKGTGLWPAFWMMPQDGAYGGWPRSGEIDIMEARGRVPGQVSGALHYGYPEITKHGVGMLPSTSDITDWHVYALEWTPASIALFVDGRCYLQQNLAVVSTITESGQTVSGPAPFDKPFYVILNLAVGGKFDENRMPDKSSFGALMEVDYVRVYSLQ